MNKQLTEQLRTEINLMVNAKAGELIDMLFKVRAVRAEISAMLKDANEVKESIEAKIIAKMDEEQIERAEGRLGSVGKGVAIYPGVKDKEAFTRWVVLEGKFEMLQSRCAPAAIMELFNQQNILPDGIETYTKVKLNVRTK